MKPYYFSHDSNAKDDPNIILLIEQLGLEGYGIYWVLIEILREQPGYKYPSKALPAIARRYLTSKEKVETVVKAYGLFRIVEDEFFLSDSLNKRMALVDKKRKVLSEAGKRGNRQRWHKQGYSSPGDNQTIATQSQRKELSTKVDTYQYSKFYDKELKKSIHNQEYETVIQILFAKNPDGTDSGERKLDAVLRMPQQLTYTEFQKMMYYKQKYGIKAGEILRSMENNKKLKDRVNLWLTFQTYMKNAYPETKNK